MIEVGKVKQGGTKAIEHSSSISSSIGRVNTTVDVMKPCDILHNVRTVHMHLWRS